MRLSLSLLLWPSATSTTEHIAETMKSVRIHISPAAMRGVISSDSPAPSVQPSTVTCQSSGASEMGNNRGEPSVKKHLVRWSVVLLVALISLVTVSPVNRSVEAAAPVILSDDELGEVRGGDLDIVFDGKTAMFTSSVADNAARNFSMTVDQSAFAGAQGIFTTLQAVNSAVNLNVIVNIYLTGTASTGIAS